MQIARLAGAPVLVQSSWFLVAAAIAVLSAPVIARVHPGLGGWRFAIGALLAVLLYATVLLHEASHAFMARAFGFRVESITLNLLGGATVMDGEARTPRQEFWIAVVGPITSLGCAVVAWLSTLLPTEGNLTWYGLSALAYANLVVGVTNLLPALPLDGGRVLKAAVWQASGNQHRGTVVAAWGGRGLAVVAVVVPLVLWARGSQPDLFSVVIWLVIAGFLWTGASAFLANARLREKLPNLRARELLSPTVVVDGSLSVAQALDKAALAGATAMVVATGDGPITHVVSERALGGVPLERLSVMAVRDVARHLDPGMALPADIDGESLLRALSRVPAESYVLVESDGAMAGVLRTADVDAAYRAVANQ